MSNFHYHKTDLLYSRNHNVKSVLIFFFLVEVYFVCFNNQTNCFIFALENESLQIQYTWYWNCYFTKYIDSLFSELLSVQIFIHIA